MFSLNEFNPWTIYRMLIALQDVISGMLVNTSKDNIQTSPYFDNPLDNPRIKTLMELLDGLEEKTIIFCKYHINQQKANSACQTHRPMCIPSAATTALKSQTANGICGQQG